ncbi:MAG: glutathione S-transferase family protein [Alphaproteobacteria bacterium]|nr:glutathione S-transferase family protein [Alphaproteobacteria bacterium]
MKLYVADKAPNPDRVRYFLQEKGIWDKVEREEISIMKKEHKEAEYRAISPLSQVPALVLDDGTAITESRAICTYFEATNPEPNLMGATPKERAVIEMWDRRMELTYLLPVAHWFRNAHPAMAELEKPQSAEWAEISSGRARKMAEFIDLHLKSTTYVAADRFSIADITLFVALGFGRIMKFKPWEDLPNLAHWRDRISERPGLQ